MSKQKSSVRARSYRAYRCIGLFSQDSVLGYHSAAVPASHTRHSRAGGSYTMPPILGKLWLWSLAIRVVMCVAKDILLLKVLESFSGKYVLYVAYPNGGERRPRAR
jgi:hypothetical protein